MADVVSVKSGDTITKFESIIDAVEFASDNDIIELLADIEVASPLSISGKSVTLNLNGYTYSTDTTHKVDGIIITDAGKLILQDNSESNSGKLISTRNGVFVGSTSSFEVNNEFIMDSGYIESQEFGVAVFGCGSITINSGTIIAKDNGAVGANGSKKYAPYPYTITINGGTLIGKTESAGYANCGLYAPNAGNVYVNGGSITGEAGAGIVMRGGNVVVTGGSISGCGDSQGLRMGDANPTFCGGIEICNSANYPGEMGTCSIQGGSIQSLHNAGLLVIGNPSDPSTPNAQKSAVAIQGGSFTGNPYALNYIEADGSEISQLDSSKVVISKGSFNSDVSEWLPSDVEIEKIVNPDGSISYIVKNTLNDIYNNTEIISNNVSTISDGVNSANNQLGDLVSYTLENNQNVSDLTQTVNNLNTLTQKISTDVAEIAASGGGASPKTEDEIYELMIDTLVKNAVKTGETRAIWQHPMNDVVKAYCESHGYKLSRFVGINPPAKLGDQWLVVISE